MDFSIDRLTTNRWGLNPNAAQTPGQIAEELTFRNELAALQVEQPDSEDSPDTGLSSLLDPYTSLRFRLGENQGSPDCIPQAAASATGETVKIPAGSEGVPQLAAINNNPGNLRFAHQAGATPGAGGFARFETPETGYRALIDQVRLDASRGRTLAQYIAKYAPPSENDTAQYIAQACQSLGVAENTPLASLDPSRVAAFQARKESGTIVG